ncbi:uncharacterized protein ARMOST_13817 [Armillaria ostoyae]|uniref:Uncharacterized protein n=1 Tax=Armillaria ostoyae TaxID=47428 RepID=A0A284RNW0_ARMOS|nr:uncharacterized protein ARMOST_13817 [Armillaria ostoyae]
MAPAEDSSELLSGKCKRTKMEQSKAGRAQSPMSTTSVLSTVSKAKKKIKDVVKKVKKIASGVVKGKKTVTSPHEYLFLSWCHTCSVSKCVILQKSINYT